MFPSHALLAFGFPNLVTSLMLVIIAPSQPPYVVSTRNTDVLLAPSDQLSTLRSFRSHAAMTVAIPCHRALTQKITTRSFSVVARLPIVSTVSRVRATTDRRNGHKLRLPLYASRNSQIATRTYATSSSTKPASRPKAHAGQEAAARRPKSSTKKDASSKPGPKTSKGKSKVGRKPKVNSTASKPKSQAAKTKEKKKPLSKTALNRHRLQGIKDLRAKALLTEPKKLPATVWAIIFNEGKKPGQNVEDSQKSTQQAAERLKNLTAEEKEVSNDTTTLG